MKISLNHIRYYQRQYGWSEEPAPLGVDDLAERIGSQLGGIEEILKPGEAYQGILIAKVVSCHKHPDADKLNVCFIDDGGKAEAVGRNEQGLVQVVCGAPNVREGLTVAWLPPGSTVPESYGKDPFVLGSRELRGVTSNGMLASPRELALGDSHDGILEIDDEVAPGTSFAEHYGLAGDVVFDIENKMFTHRPDCFGMLGVAREIAGIQGQQFTSPAIYQEPNATEGDNDSGLPLTVRNELPELVPRFVAQTFENITVKPSPVWMQVDLMRLGVRPINNIVDLTNYYMLLTGQPLHAYDYDKVKALDGGQAASLVVRHARPGEAIKLLNGKTIEPRPEAIMIATEKTLIGVGGVMGGADTEVDSTTTRIILECATFDMYSIRRTSMAHGLFTDAVARFNKGQSPLQNARVVAWVRQALTQQLSNAVSGTVQDVIADNIKEAVGRDSVHPPVTVAADFINTRLGLALDAEAIRALLANVEFDVQTDGATLTVQAPFWRTDIEIPEDVVEEVGRLYGYDRLPLELPRRHAAPTARNDMIDLKHVVRDSLSRAGANEVLSYSFVHGKLLAAVGQDTSQAYELSNALSPDLQFYRLSLTPSLLDKVHGNIKAGYASLALFEIGKAHVVGNNDQEGLPEEFERLALVFAADQKAAAEMAGAPYYQARAYLEHVVHEIGVDGHVSYRPIGDGDTDQAVPYYAKGRAASVYIGDALLGRIGEYAPSVRKALKLPDYCAGFEISINVLRQHMNTGSRYVTLPRYPKVEQDLCLRTPTDVSYAQSYQLFTSELDKVKPEHVRTTVTPIDIYQRPDDSNYKQTTFRLSIASYQKTLRDEEVTAILDHISQAAATAFQAERV